MLMMRPKRRAFISGTTALIRWKAANRLIAKIAFHLSSGNSSIGATCWMPALLTMMSTLPNSARGQVGHRADLLGLAHVGVRVAHLDAVLALQFGASELDLVGVAEAVEQDVGALLGQAAGDAEADAAGRSGDDG